MKDEEAEDAVVDEEEGSGGGWCPPKGDGWTLFIPP